MATQFAFFPGCFIQIRLPHQEYVTRRVFKDLGIGLIDVEGFTCCPEPVGFGLNDKLMWLSIAARNIAVAEERELDILTTCNGCTYTLKQANTVLKENKGLRKKVNKVISSVGRQFSGTVRVRHFLEVFNEDIGNSRLKKSVKSPLSGLIVATHTGCHIVSPVDVMNFDDPHDPTVLDSFVAALGATPIDYGLKPLCCGWTLTNYGSKEAADNLLSTKLQNMRENKADCIAVVCPQCFYQFDMGQLLTARRKRLGLRIPVFFYTQLLALAMGYHLDEIHYKDHRVKNVDFENKVKAR